MSNLRNRSYQKELLDQDDIPFADIRQNMKELNTINRLLGGHAITIGGLKTILQQADKQEPITICEIGCGGGDNLTAIQNWCIKNQVETKFIGVDIKPECIAFARQQYPVLQANWIVSDYRTVDFADGKPDIIFSSLFCHHFTEEELVQMLRWMREHSSKGFFINDLHRHQLAFHSIQLITRVFSKSYLVKNDAPLSVARGFKKTEWVGLIAAAGLPQCSVKWKWAFRHLVVCINDR